MRIILASLLFTNLIISKLNSKKLLEAANDIYRKELSVQLNTVIQKENATLIN